MNAVQTAHWRLYSVFWYIDHSLFGCYCLTANEHLISILIFARHPSCFIYIHNIIPNFQMKIPFTLNWWNVRKISFLFSIWMKYETLVWMWYSYNSYLVATLHLFRHKHPRALYVCGILGICTTNNGQRCLIEILPNYRMLKHWLRWNSNDGRIHRKFGF